jgi:hypothetical protein
MTQKSCVVDRLLVVNWLTTPDETDVSAFDAAIATARQTVTPPLHHISILGKEMDMPAVGVQRALMKRAMKLKVACESLHAVYEGGGIKDRLARRFLKTMVPMVGLKGKAFVHESMAAALAQLAPQLGAPVDVVLQKLDAAGVLRA